MFPTIQTFRTHTSTGILVALAIVAIATGLFTLHGDAHAASASVGVGTPTNRFSPNVSNINVGDTVTFTWSAGTHIIDLQDVSPDLTIDSGHTSGTTAAFAKAGTFYYYCSVHATADQATEAHVQANDAMVGKIVVAGAAAAPATGGTNATAAPAAPRTGSGVASGSTTGYWFIAVGMCLVAAAGGFAAMRRR